MYIADYLKVFSASKFRRPFLLLLCWLVGSAFGCYVFISSQHLFVSLMRGVSLTSASIVGILLIIVLPFSATLLCVYYSKLSLLYPLSIIKSTIYSVCVFSVWSLFGSSGWLVQLLLLFTDNFSSAFLAFSWLFSLFSSRKASLKVCVACFVVSLILGLADYYFICPFISVLFIT